MGSKVQTKLFGESQIYEGRRRPGAREGRMGRGRGWGLRLEEGRRSICAVLSGCGGRRVQNLREKRAEYRELSPSRRSPDPRAAALRNPHSQSPPRTSQRGGAWPAGPPFTPCTALAPAPVQLWDSGERGPCAPSQPLITTSRPEAHILIFLLVWFFFFLLVFPHSFK